MECRVTTMAGEGEPEETEKCQLIPGGFAGSGPTGSFFESPGWVDREKAPGLTSQTEAVAPPGWWLELLTGRFLFFSPNLVWLTVALLEYTIFPYDFQAARSLTRLDWVYKRSLSSVSSVSPIV